MLIYFLFLFFIILRQINCGFAIKSKNEIAQINRKSTSGHFAVRNYSQETTTAGFKNAEFLYTLKPEQYSPPAKTPFGTSNVPLVRLTRDILALNRYDIRVRPVVNHSESLKIHISMSLYQIIEVNEPAQYIKMNVWMIQKWKDEMLDWDPRNYDMINSTILPHEVLWIPDTYLYNSVVMSAEETERYMNIRADSLFWEGKRGANMSFLYPAIYTITCRLNIRYFPYDQQNCTLTISSWTNSMVALDYYADENVNMASFIMHEEWHVISFKIYRHEYLYACCPEPWVILEASIVLRRKPLYYVINLIIPTSIITIVAITGFFTPASTADDRTEKINLGITTLLAMSILMLMVSDQMPQTSEFIPLIAWFYLSTIIIISIGTFMTSVILSIQGRRAYGRLPPQKIRFFFFTKLTKLLCLSIPLQLQTIWEEMDDFPDSHLKSNKRREKENPKIQNELNVRTTLTRATPSNERSPSKRKWLNERARLNWKRLSKVMREHVASSANDIAKDESKIAENKEETIEKCDGSLASSCLLSSPRKRGRKTSKSEMKFGNAISVLMSGSDVGSKRYYRSESESRDIRSPLASSRVNANVYAEINEMKRRRQCSLEWEFIAAILDRFFLIIFVFTVIFVTFGMIMVGTIAQLHYDQAVEESN